THSAFVRSPRPMPDTTSQQSDSHKIRRTLPSPGLAQLLGRPLTDPLSVATDTAAAMRPDAS
ncbi:hypothetical protein, partial [Streptomyces sp. NPDC056410]|uniref:hypothetical protein n=2 Tax=unclassified Streptomyces TaxID=2593676 RepID=UPI0035E16821